MKYLAVILFVLTQLSLQAQTVDPAPQDKAVVYFTRVSGAGALISFTYFDGENVIGKFSGSGYFRYECDPGEHYIWAHSENNDYVRANLEAGEIYVIDVIPTMGFAVAGVNLSPVNSPDYKIKKIKKILLKDKFLKTFTDEELYKWQVRFDEIIEKVLDRSDSKISMNKTESLGRYSFTPEDLVFNKK